VSVTPGLPEGFRSLRGILGGSGCMCGAFPKVDYKLKALVIAVLSQEEMG